MSAGYGPPAVNTFGMIAGLGDAFGRSYEAARQRAQEDEAPELFGRLLKVQAGGTDAAPAAGGTLGTLAEGYRKPRVPTFASTDGAMGDYLATTRAKESGGNDAAKNPNSTATGRYQFTAETWGGLARKYPDLGLTPNGRTDPAQQERAMQAFTRDNANALTAAGVPINPGNLYVSHFLGEAGGPRFIAGAMSNPDAPATSFVSPGAARANRSIFFNRDGSPKTAGEVYAERTSRFAGGGPVARPTLPARTAAAEPAMTLPRAPSPAPGSLQAPLAQAGGPAMAMPAPVAQAATAPAADMPAQGAQPAGFQIPGQPAPAAAPQGFPGFGSPASRIAPEQQAILSAAWKNPVTRPMATQIYGQLLKGRESQWDLNTMGDQPVLFNKATGQIVPVGEAKRNTATVGNTVIDTRTGQPIYQGEPEPKTATVGNTVVDVRTGQPIFSAPEKPQTVAAGSTLVGPDGRVIFQAPDKDGGGFTLSPGQSRFDATGKPIANAPDRDKTSDGEAKLRGEFSKQLGTFGDVQDGYRRLIAATEQRESNPGSISPASDIALIFGYMKMLDPGSVVREGEYATAQNAAGVPDRVRNAYNKAMSGEFLTPEQRQDFVDTAGRVYGQARQQAEGVAGRYRELARGQGLDEGRVVALPDALQGPKVGERRGGQGTALPKGKDRAAIPGGKSAGAAVAEAKAAVAAGKDKAAIAERLRSWGIDPKRLDE